MRIRTRLATIATAVVLAAVPLGNTAANAATHHENDLRTFCNSRHHVACVETADNDEGKFVVRDQAGHRHAMYGSTAALRYFKRHSIPCKQEDSARCYWDASSRGNGVGDSFIVIGGKAEGTGTLWYLGNLD